MFPLGLFIVAAAIYLIDSGIRNRHPVGTIRDIISDPKRARQTLAEASGTWTEPISPGTESMMRGDGPSLAPGAIATVVGYARAQVGKPYKYGASGPNAFDCSGLIFAAYMRAGVPIPRTTAGQLAAGTKVARNELRPGDLIFPYPGHVYLYIGGTGDHACIEAPHTGERVKYTSVYRFWTARRFVS